MARSEEKNRLILDAAIAEFLEMGFERASMDRVAEAAGVSKRTVYKHFAGKEALFGAIAKAGCEQIAATLSQDYDPARPLRSQLLELGQAEARLLRDQNFMRLARMATSELMRDPGLAERLGFRSPHEEIFLRFFQNAAEAGAIRPDAPLLATTQFIGLIKSQGYWPAIFSGQLLGQNELDGIVETSVDTVMAAFAMDTG